MTLSTVDFDCRSDAMSDAELNGFDVSSVSVRVDAMSGRYQWHLRDFGGALAIADGSVADGDVSGDVVNDAADAAAAPSGAVDGADVDACVVADAVADVVASLAPVGSEVVDTLDAPVLGDIDVSAGFGAVTVADGGIAGVSGDVASVRRCVVQLDAEMSAADAYALAGLVFAQCGIIVSIRDASVAKPVRAAGGVRSARVASVPTSIVREESTLDRCKRGVWLDCEVPESNKTILNLKHKIEAARGSLDMDALRAIEFKTVSTYYNQARAYLGHAILAVEAALIAAEAKRAADEAALTAEYGF